jgi:hypothetical protein
MFGARGALTCLTIDTSSRSSRPVAAETRASFAASPSDEVADSLATAAALMLYRLIKRDTLMHSISGFIGVAFCGWLAWRTGEAKDYYAPSLWKNSAFMLVYLVSILIKYPLIGVLLGPILGENLKWRKDPKRLAAYTKATWIWFALFAIRLAVQYPLFKADQLNALGIANIFLGFPLYLATLWGTWMVIRSVPITKAD